MHSSAKWPVALKNIVDNREKVWVFDAIDREHAQHIVRRMRGKYHAGDMGLLVTSRHGLVVVVNLAEVGVDSEDWRYRDILKRRCR